MGVYLTIFTNELVNSDEFVNPIKRKTVFLILENLIILNNKITSIVN